LNLSVHVLLAPLLDTCRALLLHEVWLWLLTLGAYARGTIVVVCVSVSITTRMYFVVELSDYSCSNANGQPWEKWSKIFHFL
jgi:hypothetical protein